MEKTKFTLDSIRNMAREISDNNIVAFEELPQYDLFLSQVIDYLNDKFEMEKYTNNIVQNYIKSEVICKPEDGKKRGYTKLHLAQLVLLSYMRPILTTEEIKKVFGLAFNDINDRTDDVISWEKAYKIFSDIQKEICNDILDKDFLNEEKFKKIIQDSEVDNKDQEKILVFLVVMTLIAQASAIKKLAHKIVNSYSDAD